MGYRNLNECVRDLERTGQLHRIDAEIDPYLEAAEIHRRVYAAGGPALLFTRVKGCRFPMVSNLFGTLERTRFIFRDTVESLSRLMHLKADPSGLKQFWRYVNLPWTLMNAMPKRVENAPILEHRCPVTALPQLVCWPRDGGPFVTLPQVYTEHPDRPGWRHSNMGMYRVQLGGNEYTPDQQVGMHYQIHRGIGVHHAAALARGERLRVVISVGGPPALAVSAVMPLPEGMPEIAFAGVLAGHRIRLTNTDPPMPAEADFCIVGSIDTTKLMPEGPFGDHLGYYSLTHPFPVVDVEAVYHRPGAIWPFTVVGRPPQEDTSFGEFIHDLTGPVIPSVLPGVKEVHAVDAAGVHPLLLAIGSERYVPYAEERTPQELLTIASAILGQGQLSLAKYLLIAAREDDPKLSTHDVGGFLRHLLERLDPEKDLHFHTRTTIDTLDYSGCGINQGSKVVIAVAGNPRRELPSSLPSDRDLVHGMGRARFVIPGVLAVAPGALPVADFCSRFTSNDPINHYPLIILVDDADFVATRLENFLWVTFTRSDPAADIHGIDSFVHEKHWGCRGSVVIDARIKPRHAPPVEPDPEVSRRVDALAAPNGPLHGLV